MKRQQEKRVERNKQSKIKRDESKKVDQAFEMLKVDMISSSVAQALKADKGAPSEVALTGSFPLGLRFLGSIGAGEHESLELHSVGGNGEDT